MIQGRMQDDHSPCASHSKINLLPISATYGDANIVPHPVTHQRQEATNVANPDQALPFCAPVLADFFHRHPLLSSCHNGALASVQPISTAHHRSIHERVFLPAVRGRQDAISRDNLVFGGKSDTTTTLRPRPRCATVNPTPTARRALSPVDILDKKVQLPESKKNVKPVSTNLSMTVESPVE